MLNFLWAGMIGVGILYGAFQGRLGEITNAVLDSSREAVSLSISMIGVIAFWMGLMQIAEKSGMVQMISKAILPVIRFLFPNIPRNHKSNEYITMNFVANMLGLGWAATPSGLKAMESLEELEEERRRQGSVLSRPKAVASDEMCIFLIMNISSLQLIPVNIIAYRSQYGSVDPARIIGAGLIATSISTLAAVFYCKLCSHTFKGLSNLNI